MNKRLLKFIMPVLVIAGLSTSLVWALDWNANRQENIVKYIRTKFNIPQNLSIVLGKPSPSQISGLEEFNVSFLEAGKEKGKLPFLISKDGRYVIGGRYTIFDISKDPIKEVLDKISYLNQHVKGNPTSDITIVEYSDFQCDFCRRLHVTLKDVMGVYEKRVHFIYKHFPLTTIHPWAEQAAIASECAAVQKKESFWVFHDFFFEQQKSLNANNLLGKASQLAVRNKLNKKTFEKCVKNKETYAKVMEDVKEAKALGVTGTPHTIINGHTLSGALSVEQLSAALDTQIKKLKAKK